jgi:4-amino-4-deoxy-L-arabinose transferase-like glycosyltransferase
MWIRKSPNELKLEKQVKLLGGFFWIAALWAIFWTTFTGFHFLPRDGRTALLASIPAVGIFLWALLLGRQSRRNRKKTVVCDRCNIVTADEIGPKCKCGGDYYNIAEMKWAPPRSSGDSLSTGPRSPLTNAG